MHKASLKDFILLIALAAIWGSAFLILKLPRLITHPWLLLLGAYFLLLWL
jgi:hypothetical protein